MSTIWNNCPPFIPEKTQALVGFLKCTEEVARRLSEDYAGTLRGVRLESLADHLKAEASALSREGTY